MSKSGWKWYALAAALFGGFCFLGWVAESEARAVAECKANGGEWKEVDRVTAIVYAGKVPVPVQTPIYGCVK